MAREPELAVTCDAPQFISAEFVERPGLDTLDLLRLIQFFNTGGYTYCPESGTEDGFCPAWQ